ncbi:MAG: patatin-like phospholipase family protein [Pseudorhodoferax sp.]
MKGGITSGVVYPKAIATLARHYRFKNIGGTSAGAIAAAVTAAAEYRRRTTGTRAGFDHLEQLPEALQEEVAPGRRRLLSLFQPQPRTRRLFSVLAAALNSASAGQRIRRIVLGAVRAYWPATLAAIVLALVAAWLGSGLYGAVLTAVVALVAGLAAGVLRDATGPVVANGFGLCQGTGTDARLPALMPWLHTQIQTAAGLSENEPLTFGHLWEAPGFPVGPFTVPEGATRKSIHLQIFSTNLSHGRPYIFPLAAANETPTGFRTQDRLFFNPEDLKTYLPAVVLEHLKTHGTPYRCDPKRAGRDPSDEDAKQLGLLELPAPDKFPVLLAARLSLSFPFLISAVPLWAIHYDTPGQASFRRCWFSDGGLSSNFPMHLFDSLVPCWPTFGINLEDVIDQRERVYLPKKYTSGYGERWHLFGKKDLGRPDADDPQQATTSGFSRLGGFVLALVNTMQNWNDNALSRMPGVRDRIVRVRLASNEGGLNLNMEPETLTNVAGRGEKAADELLAQFSNGGPGWDEQRWVRLSVLLRLLQERAPGVLTALQQDLPHATDFQRIAERAVDSGTAPAGYEKPLTPEQHKALLRAIEALQEFMRACTDKTAATAFEPVPRPELRLRPPL